MARNDDIVTYRITDHIADLQEKNNGWMKELNLVCWNGNKTPKFDIRDWSQDHQRMSRGLTFTEYEFDRMVQEYLAWRSDAVVKQKRAERQASDLESRRQREMRSPAPEPEHIPDPIPPAEPAAPASAAPPESSPADTDCADEAAPPESAASDTGFAEEPDEPCAELPA